MTITALPTRAALDLGATISNVRTPVSNELSAVNVEKIKDWIIALASEVGLSDGSTAGSLREAIDALSGGGALFELDTTVTTDVAGTTECEGESGPGGTAPAGTLTPTGNIDAEWHSTEKCLGFAVDAAHTGIHVRRIITGALPAEGYILDVGIGHADSTVFTSSLVLMLAYQQGSGTAFRGLAYALLPYGGTPAIVAVGDDGTGPPSSPVHVDTGAAMLPWDDWTRGPIRLVIEIRKTDGATPTAKWRISVKTYMRSGEVIHEQYSQTATPESGFTTPLDLDAWSPDRVGVGVWNSGSAEAYEFRLSHLRVYSLGSAIPA